MEESLLTLVELSTSILDCAKNARGDNVKGALLLAYKRQLEEIINNVDLNLEQLKKKATEAK